MKTVFILNNVENIIQSDCAYIRTSLGILKIKGDEKGVQSVQFVDEELPLTQEIPSSLKMAVEQLEAYFNGGLKSFNLNLSPEGTDFQKKVWTQLTEIPFGTTVSYMDIAKKLGDIKAIRAAAAANGKNPIAIIIPCHRVIGNDGSLTGYAGGLSRKKWLLDHESPVKQGSLF